MAALLGLFSDTREDEMMEILVLALLTAISLTIMIITGSSKKRGCGGGCATCGNRKNCHGKK
ncbi:MAG: FeoB-associated Cys-rich membrane protein [Lachnospiraceae bacterium]|jgi:hypothetical protein|nr:FeoB-associated Cys-rich membrane protein [Lachnospiraceae bacterium]